MAGTDNAVAVVDQVEAGNSSVAKNVDASQLVRPDGTTVYRQRVAIADPTDPELELRVMDVVTQRRLQELHAVGAQEFAINQLLVRGRERPYLMDQRGGTADFGRTR